MGDDLEIRSGRQPTSASVATETTTEVIQQGAAETLCRMLGQPASRLGIKDLDDLGLPQRDKQGKAAIAIKVKYPHLLQPSPYSFRPELILASRYKLAEYVVSDDETAADSDGSGDEDNHHSDSGGPGNGADSGAART
ncbi:uncharacterized protein P174DRAFT_449854 [Aspergillus novofumigatus IBT 16806]|uniref:Uncharacterized protein n=1 Tax=Aspergillus novofumigatus (strain IBT 16806) TaxID=1392255 RepID=A0A2I1CCT6_ASPN1|nr:uncharacterized protein P174DRAFT_449854 [Aspergillus novofumigatus IBT 16806]PKX95438.1 hypothetical protein P174DRAFT_449854 [Aspergillus novofumigatus IBT 16806]